MNSSSEATLKQPTPQQLDALVAKLDKATEAQKPTAKQQAAAKLAGELRAQLLALTLQFGEVPKSAPASKRLRGETVTLTATTSSYTTQHPEAVLELRDAMTANGHQALFAQLYTPTTKYDRAKDALNNLRSFDLPKKVRALYDGIFARTATEGQRAPSLRIDKAA